MVANSQLKKKDNYKSGPTISANLTFQRLQPKTEQYFGALHLI